MAEPIDRDQLTEALEHLNEMLAASQTGLSYPNTVIVDAARLLLDFPTDEQVEAAAKAIAAERRGDPTNPRVGDFQDAREALEAVRRTMIGDDQ